MFEVGERVRIIRGEKFYQGRVGKIIQVDVLDNTWYTVDIQGHALLFVDGEITSL